MGTQWSRVQYGDTVVKGTVLGYNGEGYSLGMQCEGYSMGIQW